MRTPTLLVVWRNMPLVVCDDGAAFIWTVAPLSIDASPAERAEYDRNMMLNGAEWMPHAWVRFHQPIPGTASDAAYHEQHESQI